MISEVMENGPRHTLQIGSDCLGVKGESFMEHGENRGGSGGGVHVVGGASHLETTKK